jgi:hypothetical protein
MTTYAPRPSWRRRGAVAAGIGALVLAGASSGVLLLRQHRPEPARRTALELPALGGETRYLSGDLDIDAIQDLLRETLEANRKEFPGRGGSVRGFGAGDAYPQVWLRDSATILPLARYYYGRAELAGWLEEHLASQRPGGELFDWIARGAPQPFLPWAPRALEVFRQDGIQVSADKNTTESDQETSAVDAVFNVYQATRDRAWLGKRLGTATVLERSVRALDSLVKTRRDPATGLITSALTADWGDVSPLYPDQRAIYRDPRTPAVVGLYTNALFCKAATELAAILDDVGDRAGAGRWRAEAEHVRRALNLRLWQEKRGFYGMHRILRPEMVRGFPDDSDMFAMGGHAVALLAGVADAGRARRILDLAERRRVQYGVGTIAASLLPPYPAGAFQHPAMKEEWRYQNGGQWDWFAGRLVLAEFRLGYSERAFTHLAGLARRARRAGGLFEWYERDGTGRGSARYAGSAAALGDALMAGLYGVDLGAQRLDVTLRLGARDGGLTLSEPASGRALTLAQRLDRAQGTLSVTWASRGAGHGTLRVRIPGGWRAESAMLGGREVAFARETLGEDAYVSLASDWPAGRLVIALAGQTVGGN